MQFACWGTGVIGMWPGGRWRGGRQVVGGAEAAEAGHDLLCHQGVGRQVGGCFHCRQGSQNQPVRTKTASANNSGEAGRDINTAAMRCQVGGRRSMHR